jgi:hypothetical protein
MVHSDTYIMVAVQGALVLFAGFAVVKDAYIRFIERRRGISATVTRAPSSMAPIYTVYVASLASCLVLIDKALAFEGNKVGLVVIDFVCLTYLFFFSTWFRNRIFYPLAERVRKD